MKIDMEEELLKVFVEYCYTGTLKIDKDTQLLPFYKFCTINRIDNFQTFFNQQFDDFITPQNVLVILEECHSIISESIQEKCLKVMANNIDTIANEPNFAKISALDLGKLLRRDDLAVELEENVLEIFLKWYYKRSDFTLNSSPIRSSRFIQNGKYVLSAIRLPLIESQVNFHFQSEANISKKKKNHFSSSVCEKVCGKNLVNLRCE